jgi:alkylhydroperoxidase family enzyme
MFAVIARQMDCGDCVGEAKRLTLEEGLCEAEFDACLATLSSPRLDAPEAKLLEWARETIRYQPHIIQKRTEPLVAELGPEAMLEAVGVASLANATIRLAALL